MSIAIGLGIGVPWDNQAGAAGSGAVYGRNIGMDLGSGATVGTGPLVGVVPYVNWVQYSGAPNFGATQLRDDEDTLLAATAEGVGAAGNSSGLSPIDATNDQVMFQRLLRSQSGGGLSYLEFLGIPYAKYDVITIHETASGSPVTFMGSRITDTSDVELMPFIYVGNNANGNWAGAYIKGISENSSVVDDTANYVCHTGITEANFRLEHKSGSVGAGGLAAMQIVERLDGEVVTDWAVRYPLRAGETGGVNSPAAITGVSNPDLAGTNFNGVDQYFDKAADSAVAAVGTGAYAISAWFRTIGTTDGGIFANGTGGGTGTFRLVVRSGGDLAIRSGGLQLFSTASGLNDGEWHHVVCTSSGASGTTTFYIDGVFDSAQTSQGYNLADVGLFIGASSGPSNLINGDIDDVRFYQRELSSGDATAIYDARQDLPNDYLLRYTMTTSESGQVNTPPGVTGPALSDQEGLSFNGVDQYLDKGSDSATYAVGTGAWTVSFWTKTTTTTLATYCGNGLGNDGEDWRLRPTSGGTVTLRLAGNSYTSATSVNDGNWHMVTLVVTGSGGALTYYIDGVEDAQFTAPTYNITDSGEYGVAARGNGAQTALADMDDHRFYDRVLSPAEILRIYNDAVIP